MEKALKNHEPHYYLQKQHRHTLAAKEDEDKNGYNGHVFLIGTKKIEESSGPLGKIKRCRMEETKRLHYLRLLKYCVSALLVVEYK